METYISKDQITIGTKFMSGGKASRLCTVVDILKTYNSKNELVKTSYQATHEFLGQIVTDHDVCAVTIQRGVARLAQITPAK
jgi:hypothetical protein